MGIHGTHVQTNHQKYALNVNHRTGMRKGGKKAKMSSILVISIWKKGTNRYTSEADYHIEIDQGETYQISALIGAISEIANAIKEVER